MPPEVKYDKRQLLDLTPFGNKLFICSSNRVLSSLIVLCRKLLLNWSICACWLVSTARTVYHVRTYCARLVHNETNKAFCCDVVSEFEYIQPLC